MSDLGETTLETESADRFVRWSGPRRAVAELKRRNAILFGVAVAQTALFVVFVAGIALDPRTIGGDPAWLKPAKFAGSIALFAATLGWLGYHLPVPERLLRRVSIAVAVAAFVEIALIGGQASRGVESHFNDSTVLDHSIYVVMGVTIAVMTALVAWLLARSWRRAFDVAPAFAWGIRIGIGLFVVGALEGAVMIALGAGDVGSGSTVPIVGWVTGGDLRVAHFVGLHGLQFLPFVGYLSTVAAERGVLERPTRVVLVVAGAYALGLVAAFLHGIAPVFS